jgi:hypothetical protein
MMYVLLIILTGNPSFFPSVSWHTSRKACERHATIELEQVSMINKAVEHVPCRPYVVRPLPPVTDATLLR